jgi:hypothetical protein
VLPRYYGIAYYDCLSATAWCYPKPLHLIVRAWVSILDRLRPVSVPLAGVYGEADLAAAKLDAYSEGFDAGQKAIWAHIDAQISNMSKRSDIQ